jgi:hypothetical protein
MKTNPTTTFIQLLRIEKKNKYNEKNTKKEKKKEKSYLNLIVSDAKKRKEKTNS